jgi:cytochrome P450
MAMRYEEMPAWPGGHSILGHNPEIRSDRLGFARRVAAAKVPLARLRVPLAEVCIANDPEVLHELLVERARSFDKSSMVRWSLYPLAGEGIFTSGGELWRRQRKLMAPLFHPAQLGRYAGDMLACAERSLAAFVDGAEVRVAHETTRVTMAIAGKTLFDADTFGETDDIGPALTAALDWSGAVGGSPLSVAHLVPRRFALRTADGLRRTAVSGAGALANWLERAARTLDGPIAIPGEEGRRVRAAIATLDAYVQRLIDERRARMASGSEPERADLLTRLLAARDADDGSAMTDKQVRDEVLTLFVAGHETTATGLAWSLYELARDRALYDEVEREIDALGRAPTADDLPALSLTLRVFKEALRKYPPVYLFGRTSNEPTSLGGFELARDANVLVAPSALHFREDLWPHPERFDPARFLPEAEASRSRLAWLPFGGGPRICLGNHFALMEAQLVLATWLRHVRFEAVGTDEPDPGATLRPKHGVRMRVRRR